MRVTHEHCFSIVFSSASMLVCVATIKVCKRLQGQPLFVGNIVALQDVILLGLSLLSNLFHALD